jgi:hypothetical protein
VDHCFIIGLLNEGIVEALQRSEKWGWKTVSMDDSLPEYSDYATQFGDYTAHNESLIKFWYAFENDLLWGKDEIYLGMLELVWKWCKKTKNAKKIKIKFKFFLNFFLKNLTSLKKSRKKYKI